MLEVTVDNNSLQFGSGVRLTFHRTLRIPDDGRTYPLPPSLGRFPILNVADYADRVPEQWAAEGGFFIPMYQREALWISFQYRHWKPNAVKIAVGEINAVSGKAWDEELHDAEEDYLVCPPQPWLDGINAGEGFIRQFVAMPLGQGYTVEAQVRGEEKHGGVQIIVYEPRPGLFPDEAPKRGGFLRGEQVAFMAAPPPAAAPKSAEMGLAAGGKMKQKIYPDPHGIDTWDQDNHGVARVHIVNSTVFQAITGQEPPATPIDAETYTKHGFPWFDLYDEHQGDIAAPEELQKVKSVKEKDEEAGLEGQQDDTAVDVPGEQIKKYKFGE